MYELYLFYFVFLLYSKVSEMVPTLCESSRNLFMKKVSEVNLVRMAVLKLGAEGPYLSNP